MLILPLPYSPKGTHPLTILMEGRGKTGQFLSAKKADSYCKSRPRVRHIASEMNSFFFALLEFISHSSVSNQQLFVFLPSQPAPCTVKQSIWQPTDRNIASLHLLLFTTSSATNSNMTCIASMTAHITTAGRSTAVAFCQHSSCNTLDCRRLILCTFYSVLSYLKEISIFCI